MSDSNAQSLRQLKIKTGVVKRLFKEESTYIQEVVDQKRVVEKLEKEEAEGADIRAAQRVLRDSEMMVPRTRKQLEESYEALEDLVNALQSENAIAESAEWKDASSQLKVVEAAWKAEAEGK